MLINKHVIKDHLAGRIERLSNIASMRVIDGISKDMFRVYGLAKKSTETVGFFK